MRGLGDDRVVRLAGQPESVARVVDHDIEPRIRQWIDVAHAREQAVRHDHLRFKLHHVDAFHRRRYALERDAAAEADHEHVPDVGARDDGQRGQPLLRIKPGRRAPDRDGGFGKAVGAQVVVSARGQQHHGGGAPDAVIEFPWRGRIVHGETGA